MSNAIRNSILVEARSFMTKSCNRWLKSIGAKIACSKSGTWVLTLSDGTQESHASIREMCETKEWGSMLNAFDTQHKYRDLIGTPYINYC